MGSVLDRLAGVQGVRGSEPDKELARELAEENSFPALKGTKAMFRKLMDNQDRKSVV